jgi:hypothetical protein
MARRPSGSANVSMYKGRFHRTLGKTLNAHDQVVPKKFLLGTDPIEAGIAAPLLERLWQEVVAEHEVAVEWMQRIGGRLADMDLTSGSCDRTRLRRLDRGPIWRAESLAIAEAIRSGRREVIVHVGDPPSKPAEYVRRIAELRSTYSIIAFAPASLQLYATGQQELASEAHLVADDAQAYVQALSALANAPLPVANGKSLHQALDAYAQFAQQKNRKGFGQVEAASAKRLKNAHVDIPLAAFGISAMEAIATYWADRPVAKKTGRPVALSTIINHLKTARRFVRWLHRTDAFEWTKPDDAEQALQVRAQALRNADEIAALGKGIAVWTIDELTILYQFASDFERLVILLCLNCGFSQAEIITLRPEEVVHAGGNATIKRIRHKNQVYGEFVLWPETLAGLTWFMSRCRPSGAAADFVMVTGKGQVYLRQDLANMWNRLVARVQTKHPVFRRRPFKYLRKTGGQLVRNHSDGEVSRVFLCHGNAVVSDDLADVYTNRPFDKVAKALALVHLDLAPMFAAAPQAFDGKSAAAATAARPTSIPKREREQLAAR